jgi:hypothetical protein
MEGLTLKRIVLPAKPRLPNQLSLTSKASKQKTTKKSQTDGLSLAALVLSRRLKNIFNN